jgi:hypothetical protein
MVEQIQYWDSPLLCSYLNMVLLMGKVTMMFMTPAPYPAANSRQSEIINLDSAMENAEKSAQF